MFATIPDELVLRIADFLPLADLLNLRLAGVGSSPALPAQPQPHPRVNADGRDAPLHAQLGVAFRARVRALQRLTRDLSGPSVGRAHMSYFLGPDVFYPCWNRNCSRYTRVLVSASLSSSPSGHKQAGSESAASTTVTPTGTQEGGSTSAPASSSSSSSSYSSSRLLAPPRPSPSLPPLSNPAAAPRGHGMRAYVPCSECHLAPGALSAATGAAPRRVRTQRADEAYLSGLAAHLPRLQRLQLCMAAPASLRPLPEFGALRSVELYRCSFAALPPGLLALGPRLVELVLRHMNALEALPPDLGVRCPALTHFSLVACRGELVVPGSAWHALERNFVAGKSRVVVADKDGAMREGPAYGELVEKHCPQIFDVLLNR